MIREMLSVLLTSVFVLQVGLDARATAFGVAGPRGPRPSKKLALKEKVLTIPPNTMVRVRMHDKKQLRGRLGQVSDEGFVLKVASGDTIQDRQIAFTDVKSIKKEKGRASRASTWILVGVLAGAAVAIIVIVGIAANSD